MQCAWLETAQQLTW